MQSLSKEKMTVKVLTCTAGDILMPVSEEKMVGQLCIPEYQRPYCWQKQQLEQLLTDIKVQNEESADLPYYLGSLILHQKNETLNIIDGQQRVTTLVLIAVSLLGESKSGSLVESLEFKDPISQQQIKYNLKWLQTRFRQNTDYWKNLLDFNKLQFTLVITQTEDDAYRFFETQNTGGVRLSGTDIIKAHHLRAVNDPSYQQIFAKQWESLGKLDDTVNALLKGRYWQRINMRELPSKSQKKQLRDTIVSELAKKTGKGEDIAFGRMHRHIGLAGDISLHLAQQGYELRQPLNAGVNSIQYLSYFQRLYKYYWEKANLPHLEGYTAFIAWLKELEGCGYLEALYKACLLQYISQFGENQLEAAAKKLFRVVYSRRVSNQKAVRENSIFSFVKGTPVLDWIALSYTPKQCFNYLDRFTLIVEGSNLDINSVKKRYIDRVNDFFKLNLSSSSYAKNFAQALTDKVKGDF